MTSKVAEKLFYVLKGQNFGPKLYKTQTSVKKYQSLYPDVKVEVFTNEFDANNFLINLSKPVKKEETLEKTPNIITNEQKKPEENSEKKTFNIMNYFEENLSIFEKSKLNILKDEEYHLFFDGASKMNPGPAGCGYVFFNKETQKIYYNSLNLSFKTNNQAEYLGLIYGLNSAINLNINNIICYGDSQLVIKQMEGKFKVGSQNIYYYNKKAMELKEKFKKIDFIHIPREQNEIADKLSNEGILKYHKKQKSEQSN